MPKETLQNHLIHNLILENRESLGVSGVNEIVSFDEKEVVLKTEAGKLTVSGNGLKMSKLSVESGDVTVYGSIRSMAYSDAGADKESFFKKIFK